MKTKRSLWFLLLLLSLVSGLMVAPKPATSTSYVELTKVQTWSFAVTANIYEVHASSNGLVYLGDAVNNRIAVYDRSGIFQYNITGFLGINGIASLGNRLYVVTADNLSILQNNVLINSTPLNIPRGVDVDAAGNIYAADFSDRVVYVFSPDLTLINTISGFGNLKSVDLDSAGRIYVGDYSNRNITVLNPSLDVIAYIGSPGTGPGEIDQIGDVAVTDDGYVILSDQGLDRIQVFNPSHQSSAIITGFNNPQGVDTDGTGRLYVIDANRDNITVWETEDFGDNSGPTISNVHIAPLNPSSLDSITVIATVTDPSGVKNVTLTFTVAGFSPETVVMTGFDDEYIYPISPQPANSSVTFTIWAEDNSLAHHDTTSQAYQFNVFYPSLEPSVPLFGLDPSLLGITAVGLGGVALVIGLVALTRKPKRRGK